MEGIRIDVGGRSQEGEAEPTRREQFLVAELTRSMQVKRTSLELEQASWLFGAPLGHLSVVAEGFGGGFEAGETSSTAVESLVQYVLNVMPSFFELEDRLEPDVRSELERSVRRSEQAVKAGAEAETPPRTDTAATLTAAFVLWPAAYVVHAGDARAYLLRDSRLELISEDHTVPRKRAGDNLRQILGGERLEWERLPWNLLGGPRDSVQPEVYKLGLRPGDTVLLCTRGLFRALSDSDFVRAAEDAQGAAEICEALLDRARACGSRDTLTAAVTRVRATQGVLEATAGAQAERGAPA